MTRPTKATFGAAKENTRRYLRLQGKPFWIWSIEEHKHEDVGLMEIAALIISSVTI